MCLRLEEGSELKIGKNDIVVYKGFNFRNGKNISDLKSGDEFTGVIKGIKCSGKVSIEGDYRHLCTNNSKISGYDCIEKFGYGYSWEIDCNVTSLIVNGIELCVKRYETPYRNFKVEIGESYSSELIVEKWMNISITINHGFHSFSRLVDANRDGYPQYVKCIIPNGSKYYEGLFGCYPILASEEIILCV